jgi:hypothetical protein
MIWGSFSAISITDDTDAKVALICGLIWVVGRRRSKQPFRDKNPFVMRMTLTVLNYEVRRNRIANFN